MKANALQRRTVTILPAITCFAGTAATAEPAQGPGSSQAQVSTRPNFIVIFCDDLGYGDIGWLGPVKNHTPNIDSMAAEGACFTDFFTTITCPNSVPCVPASGNSGCL